MYQQMSEHDRVALMAAIIYASLPDVSTESRARAAEQAVSLDVWVASALREKKNVEEAQRRKGY